MNKKWHFSLWYIILFANLWFASTGSVINIIASLLMIVVNFYIDWVMYPHNFKFRFKNIYSFIPYLKNINN